jgi:hypothetical protein
VGIHCGIYKSSYNMSNISYLNSPPPLFSFILPSPHTWNRYYFKLTYMSTQYLHYIHPPTPFPHLLPNYLNLKWIFLRCFFRMSACPLLLIRASQELSWQFLCQSHRSASGRISSNSEHFNPMSLKVCMLHAPTLPGCNGQHNWNSDSRTICE